MKKEQQGMEVLFLNLIKRGVNIFDWAIVLDNTLFRYNLMGKLLGQIYTLIE